MAEPSVAASVYQGLCKGFGRLIDIHIPKLSDTFLVLSRHTPGPAGQLYVNMPSVVDFSGTLQPSHEEWVKSVYDECRTSMSFKFHDSIIKEFFASSQFLYEQMPLGKLRRSL